MVCLSWSVGVVEKLFRGGGGGGGGGGQEGRSNKLALEYFETSSTM